MDQELENIWAGCVTARKGTRKFVWQNIVSAALQRARNAFGRVRTVRYYASPCSSFKVLASVFLLTFTHSLRGGPNFFYPGAATRSVSLRFIRMTFTSIQRGAPCMHADSVPSARVCGTLPRRPPPVAVNRARACSTDGIGHLASHLTRWRCVRKHICDLFFFFYCKKQNFFNLEKRRRTLGTFYYYEQSSSENRSREKSRNNLQELWFHASMLIEYWKSIKIP